MKTSGGLPLKTSDTAEWAKVKTIGHCWMGKKPLKQAEDLLYRASGSVEWVESPRAKTSGGLPPQNIGHS